MAAPTHQDFEDLTALETALTDLGNLLGERGSPAYGLCVIGGAAFLMREPGRHHATADVDVAARVVDGEPADPRPWPGWLAAAIADIGVVHRLRRDWINDAAAASFGVRLPDGFLGRADRRTYGPLTVHVASRQDLLALKLLAAVSRRGDASARHIDDVARATPTPTEVEDALTWVRGQLSDPAAFEERITHVRASLKGGR